MPSWFLNMDVVGMLLFSPLGHSLHMTAGVEPCVLDPIANDYGLASSFSSNKPKVLKVVSLLLVWRHTRPMSR